MLKLLLTVLVAIVFLAIVLGFVALVAIAWWVVVPVVLLTGIAALAYSFVSEVIFGD